MRESLSDNRKTMKEKVFVSGADGMLGSSICRELLRQGYAVKAMCLPDRKVKTLEGLAIEQVHGNVLDKVFLLAACKDCDYVIHVAALTNVWPRRIKKLWDVNVTGTQYMAEVVEKLGIKRMVHVGSASSFNHGSMDHPGTEDSVFDGWKYGMDYLDTKYKAQEWLLQKHAQSKFPVIIINPTFMIGPYDSGPSSGQMLIGLYRGTVPGYSVGGKNFVCSFDVAVAIVNALKMGRTGQCYIAGNQNMRFHDFFKLATELMGKPFKLRAFPPSLVLIAGAANSLLARVNGKPPKLSYTMARMENVSQYFSPEKARNELNMPQTPISEGIQQCLEWFKNNGYLHET